MHLYLVKQIFHNKTKKITLACCPPPPPGLPEPKNSPLSFVNLCSQLVPMWDNYQICVALIFNGIKSMDSFCWVFWISAYFMDWTESLKLWRKKGKSGNFSLSMFDLRLDEWLCLHLHMCTWHNLVVMTTKMANIQGVLTRPDVSWALWMWLLSLSTVSDLQASNG